MLPLLLQRTSFDSHLQVTVNTPLSSSCGQKLGTIVTEDVSATTGYPDSSREKFQVALKIIKLTLNTSVEIT